MPSTCDEKDCDKNAISRSRSGSPPRKYCKTCRPEALLPDGKKQYVPLKQCRVTDHNGERCEHGIKAQGLCQGHGAKCQGDCCVCKKKRGSFTPHVFSKRGLDPSKKYCLDDSDGVEGLAREEPFVVDTSAIPSLWKSLFTVQVLGYKQLKETHWEKLSKTFLSYYLDTYIKLVADGEFVFGEHVRTAPQVEKRLLEIFDINKKSFELRPHRMVCVIYWCINKEDPIIAGFWFLRAFPDDPVKCLLELYEQVDYRSLEAVLQRSSSINFSGTAKPTEEDRLAGLDTMRQALMAKSAIGRNSAGHLEMGEQSEGDFSFMVCIQRAYLKSEEVASLRELDLPTDVVDKVMQRSLGVIPRERKNLLVMFALRRANYEKEERERSEKPPALDAASGSGAFQEGDFGVLLDDTDMFPTGNQEGDDKEGHGTWVFKLFGYQSMQTRKRKSMNLRSHKNGGNNNNGPHYMYPIFDGILDIVNHNPQPDADSDLVARATADVQRRHSM